MKAMGAIPSGFGVDANGHLLIGGFDCETVVAQAGDTPAFIYDFALIRQRIALLRSALPKQVALHFAIKANPMPSLVAAMAQLVDGLDVASAGEMQIALNSGAAHISFAGPGKRDRELEAAISAQVTLNVESLREAQRAIAIGQRIGIVPKLAVRVNPDFDLRGSGMRMGGGAKPFGIDAREAVEAVRFILDEGADWRGFHIFAGSQALDAGAIAEAQFNTVMLAGRLAESIGTVPPLVNLGGGFGIPYFSNDVAVDVAQVGLKLGETLNNAPGSLDGSRFAVELGRYLVGEAGVYLTRIVDRKISHGEIFLVTDGGLHHQLAASGNFGTVVKRNYPAAIATKFGASTSEVASIVGCLCTPLDRLADQVDLPKAVEGDLVAIFMAGAYGFSASPSGFLGHPPARELLINV